MLNIGVKKNSIVRITTPDGEVIDIVFKDIRTSRATIGIDANIKYTISRMSHRPDEQEDQPPQHQEHKPECLG